MATMYLPLVGPPAEGMWLNSVETPDTVRKSNDGTMCILKTAAHQPSVFDPYLDQVTIAYGLTEVQTHEQIKEIVNVTHKEDWIPDEL